MLVQHRVQSCRYLVELKSNSYIKQGACSLFQKTTQALPLEQAASAVSGPAVRHRVWSCTDGSASSSHTDGSYWWPWWTSPFRKSESRHPTLWSVRCNSGWNPSHQNLQFLPDDKLQEERDRQRLRVGKEVNMSSRNNVAQFKSIQHLESIWSCNIEGEFTHYLKLQCQSQKEFSAKPPGSMSRLEWQDNLFLLYFLFLFQHCLSSSFLGSFSWPAQRNAPNISALCLTPVRLLSERPYGPSHLTPLSVCLLTGHGKASQCTGLSWRLTHPSLAALSRHLDLAWHGAVWSRQHHVQVAAWHTADLPITAHTLVLTAGEKGLAVLIDGAVQNAHSSLVSWKKKCQSFSVWFVQRRKSRVRSWIKCVRLSRLTHQRRCLSSCAQWPCIHIAALCVCHRGSFQSTSALSGGHKPGSRRSHPGQGAPLADTLGAHPGIGISVDKTETRLM